MESQIFVLFINEMINRVNGGYNFTHGLGLEKFEDIKGVIRRPKSKISKG